MDDELKNIVDYVTDNPESSAREIAKALKIDKSVVNSLLYSNLKKGQIFVKKGITPPLWSCVDRQETHRYKPGFTEAKDLNYQSGAQRTDLHWYRLKRNAPPSNTDHLEK